MKFHFEATGIGSTPFTAPEKACESIRGSFPRVPFWPQLPRRSFLENMYVQYAEGMPGCRIDEAAKTIYVDSAAALEALEPLYAAYLGGDIDAFAISEERAAGLHEFARLLGASHERPPFVKGHLTGPVSFGLQVTDEKKRPLIYHHELFEAATKLLAMKARWQARFLAPLTSGKVILFLDEPYLVSIGSSYINVDMKKAMAALDEVADAAREEGALVGLHCCGNTDWATILQRNIDIISFDAYTFFKEFSLYTGELAQFLRKGRSVAWGVVPSSDAADQETVERLAGRMREALSKLQEKGIADISSFVTPSCGVGSLDTGRAEKIFGLVAGLAKELAKA